MIPLKHIGAIEDRSIDRRRKTVLQWNIDASSFVVPTVQSLQQPAEVIA
jgi:hypothetical protein